MRAQMRLWRTRDGQGLVLDGDPDAATLAYAAGDEIAAADEGKVAAILSDKDGEAEAKEQAKPADKASRPTADKARRKPADK